MRSRRLGEHDRPPRRPRARRSRRSRPQPGGNLVVYGSADLVAGLLELDLVDELRILVFPVILGSGKRLFRDEADLRQLRLLRSRPFESGAVLLTYVRQTDRTPRPRISPTTSGRPSTSSPSAPREDTDRVLATVLFTDIVDSTAKRRGTRRPCLAHACWTDTTRWRGPRSSAGAGRS